MVPLDAIDRRILAELQRDGRLANNELADRVGLSPSPCLRRVRRLEAEGVITGYAARVDPAAAGRPLVVFAHVRLERESRAAIEAFEEAVAALPEVVGCWSVLGPTDYLLRVAAADLDGYRAWYVERLAPLPGVATIESQVSFKTIADDRPLPIGPSRA